MRLPAILALVSVAALWAGSIAAYPALPPRIPVHFGAGGAPDAWARTEPLPWMALPLVTLGVGALNAALARWLPARPGLVNLPDKQRFLELVPEHRAPVLRLLQDFLHWTTVQVTLLMALVQTATFRAAHGADSSTPMLAVLLLSTIGLPGMALGLILRVRREVDRQHRLQGASEGGATA